MEWSSSFDIKRKSFYKSQKYFSDSEAITIISTYEIYFHESTYKITMSYVFNLFGSLLNEKFEMDKENKSLKEFFMVLHKFNAFIYPHLYTPLLKFAWFILIITGFIILGR